MKYFDSNLQPKDKEIKKLQLELMKYNTDINKLDELSKVFNEELVIVHKYLTIEKYLKTEDKFSQKWFYDKITKGNPNEMLDKIGMCMTVEEFAEYLDKYNKKFELVDNKL